MVKRHLTLFMVALNERVRKRPVAGQQVTDIFIRIVRFDESCRHSVGIYNTDPAEHFSVFG